MDPRPALVIAAGGAGVRLGGSKPERELGGLRLIDRAIAWALRQSDCVAVAVQRHAALAVDGVPLLRDAHEAKGPIAALVSAMDFARAAGRSHVALVGCDMPFLPEDLIVRLAEAIGDAGAACPVHDGRLQTMASLWRCDPAALAQWVEIGNGSLWRHAERTGLVRVEWPGQPADPFVNINTPADLAAAEARLRGPAR